MPPLMKSKTKTSKSIDNQSQQSNAQRTQMQMSSQDFAAATIAKDLSAWYAANHRPLPWRVNTDPYRVWLSEVMLQQTTVQAVIPYYEKFLLRFPSLASLAQASEADVLSHWSGLGYYSRARNLLRAAQQIHQTRFPQTYEELLELPGFGPYTSRAVASIAFNQSVGVLDGNVIRVLSRLVARRKAWWTNEEREHLQNLADQLAKKGKSNVINQALMELGATICTPQKPQCLLCPVFANCKVSKQDDPETYPLKRPRRKNIILHWTIELKKTNSKWAFVKNDYLPFMKQSLVFPGQVKTCEKIPPQFFVKHQIMHYSIYVSLAKKAYATKGLVWRTRTALAQENPSSLLKKIMDASEK